MISSCIATSHQVMSNPKLCFPPPNLKHRIFTCRAVRAPLRRDMDICRQKDHKAWSRPSFCGLSGYDEKGYGYMPPKGPQTLAETILLWSVNLSKELLPCKLVCASRFPLHGQVRNLFFQDRRDTPHLSRNLRPMAQGTAVVSRQRGCRC